MIVLTHGNIRNRVALASAWAFRASFATARSAELSWVPADYTADVGDKQRCETRTSSPSSSGRPRGRTASRLFRLAEEIQTLVERLQPSEEHVKCRDELVHELRRQLQSAVPGSDLASFGSVATGLWLKGSDVDLSLQVPGVEGRAEVKQVLHRVGAAIHRASGDKPERRLAARVPVLRWVPSRAGLPSCDISVNNLLALENSRLIGAYIAAEPRLRELIVVVKMWARARKINDRSRGTLSSFALTLMMIHVLQERSALCSLQDLALLRGEERREVLGFDCRFCTDPEAIAQESESVAARSEGSSSICLGSALLAFFKYFGSEYRGGVIGIRSVAAADVSSQAWCGGKYFFVDNPFQPGRDVANVEPGQLVRLREEFRRAHRELRRGSRLEDLCKFDAGDDDDDDGEDLPDRFNFGTL